MNDAAGVTLRTLVDDDLDAYVALRAHTWGYHDRDAAHAAERSRLDTTFGAFDADGRLLASAAGHHLETFVAGRRVRLLAIAAVQTVPTARRRGLAGRLLARLLERGHEAGIGWSLLYPFDPRYYARFGWQSLPTAVRLALPARWWQPLAPVAAEQVASDLRSALQPLHLRCAAGWSFTGARTDGPWDTWDALEPDPGQRVAAYALEDGYAVVRLRDEARQILTLQVIDASWCSPAGRRNVLALLGSYRDQVDRIELELPRDDALAWDWSDWWTSTTNDTRMARVVDLPSALAAIPAPCDLPEVTFAVRDPMARWNEGHWQLTPGRDGCTLEPARAGVATALDIRALPLLLSGAATPDAVTRAGLAEGERAPLATLAALAGGKTPYRAPADRF